MRREVCQSGGAKAEGGGDKVVDFDGYEIDDDPARVDFDALWQSLSTDAYWSRWRSEDDVRRQVHHAWRIIASHASGGSMVGFARATSDGVAVAYLADVYVLAQHRGRGLATAMLTELIDNGPGRDFRWMLRTQDAHDLYRKLGFATPDHTYLERASPRSAPGEAD